MAKKKAAKKWTSDELKARIMRRHPLDKGWFTCVEFNPASGSWGHAGRMDALAVCLYTSRSFAVHGFEIKVSRSDWLSELNNPAKNNIGLEELDYFWLVVPSTEIAKVTELPPKWGMLTCSGTGLRVMKQAELFKEDSAAFSRPFIVSLLWKVAKFETPGDKAIAAARVAGYAEGLKMGESLGKIRLKFDDKEFGRLRKAVDVFEERSGVSIEFGEHAGLMGDIVNALRELKSQEWLANHIEQARTESMDLTTTLAKAVKQLKGLRLLSALGIEARENG